jgi:hypothetical protein
VVNKSIHILGVVEKEKALSFERNLEFEKKEKAP